MRSLGPWGRRASSRELRTRPLQVRPHERIAGELGGHLELTDRFVQPIRGRVGEAEAVSGADAARFEGDRGPELLDRLGELAQVQRDVTQGFVGVGPRGVQPKDAAVRARGLDPVTRLQESVPENEPCALGGRVDEGGHPVLTHRPCELVRVREVARLRQGVVVQLQDLALSGELPDPAEGRQGEKPHSEGEENVVPVETGRCR